MCALLFLGFEAEFPSVSLRWEGGGCPRRRRTCQMQAHGSVTRLSAGWIRPGSRSSLRTLGSLGILWRHPGLPPRGLGSCSAGPEERRAVLAKLGCSRAPSFVGLGVRPAKGSLHIVPELTAPSCLQGSQTQCLCPGGGQQTGRRGGWLSHTPQPGNGELAEGRG